MRERGRAAGPGGEGKAEKAAGRAPREQQGPGTEELGWVPCSGRLEPGQGEGACAPQGSGTSVAPQPQPWLSGFLPSPAVLGVFGAAQGALCLRGLGGAQAGDVLEPGSLPRVSS